jgi:hypothetical protein
MSDPYRNPLRADRRQPRSDRYTDLPTEQWDRDWMVALIQQLDATLEYGLAHEIQTLADRLDYGNTLSPRESAAFAPVVKAFHRAVAEAEAKCLAGDHSFIQGDPLCLHCRGALNLAAQKDGAE